MANELARNLQDASLNPATFTLPASASSSVTSAVIDLGTDTVKPESVELELSVPALTDTMVPSTRTTTYIIETSTTSNFSAVARTIASKIYTGAGSGIAAATLRCRLPSDCERYVRAKITHGASTTDSSAVSGTLSARF